MFLSGYLKQVLGNTLATLERLLDLLSAFEVVVWDDGWLAAA